MQKTERLKLNLIEGSDSVDWAPLNENARLLEAETTAMREHLSALSADLGTGSKNCRIAVGSYVGTGTFGPDNPSRLTFDFCPAFVLIHTNVAFYDAVYLRGSSEGSICWNQSNSVKLTWGDDFVSWYHDTAAEYQNNANGYTFYYMAIGYPK